MTVTDVNVVKSAIFERPDDANKGTLGSLLCVCGSYGMAGAAVMSEKGALRTGIGLLLKRFLRAFTILSAKMQTAESQR